MTKRIGFGVAAVAIAVLVMAPSASATCLGIRNATTFGSATAYWIPFGPEGTLIGQTWQLGSPGTWSTGNCQGGPGPGGAMLEFAGPGANLNLDLGACGNGCPDSGSTLAVLAQNKYGNGADFLLATIVETPANPSANWDYGSQGNHNMIPIPRPRVLASSRVGGNVSMSVQIDSIAGGLYGPNASSAVTGFRLLQKASAFDPGRDASAYDAVPAAVFANPGGTGATQPVVLACPDTQDRWIAVQIVFEGGEINADVVGSSVRVRCDPALADPRPRSVFKKIGAPKLEGK